MNKNFKKYIKQRKRCYTCKEIVEKEVCIIYKDRIYCLTCGNKIDVKISIGDYIRTKDEGAGTEPV